jgi:CheY-like chemotaxis protein
MSSTRLTNLTVVVVEDHDDARRYLGVSLDRLRANVVAVRIGFAGLEAVKNNQPNVVLSDIAVPEMDGFELLREIRAFGAAPAARVPVVAMSAFFTDADCEDALHAGFTACLPKPFSPERLVETILTVLNNERMSFHLGKIILVAPIVWSV